MKITLISLLIATLLGFAFGASEFLAVVFAAGLLAWTIAQYNRMPRTLDAARPVHLPVKPAFSPRPGTTAIRQAA